MRLIWLLLLIPFSYKRCISAAPALPLLRRQHYLYSGLLALAANILVAILVSAAFRFSARGDRNPAQARG
jgi:hypothetical protein